MATAPTERPDVLTGRRPALGAVAWAVVVASTVPEILWVELAGVVPSWWRMVTGGGLVVMALATVVVPRLRPLRDFVLVMAMFVVLMALVPRIRLTVAELDSVLGGSVLDVRMRAEQLGKVAVALVMVSVLLAVGYRRREIFLARGDLHAPITPVRALGFPRAVPWSRFALQWSVYIAVVVALGQWLVLRPDAGTMLAVAPMTPSILLYAAVNAVTEELTYRAPLLATLEPVVGGRAALWQSAVFFGMVHYFGTPGGVGGAAVTVFLGWLLAKALLETRGLFWAWWIHFLSDVAIFTFLTAALV